MQLDFNNKYHTILGFLLANNLNCVYDLPRKVTIDKGEYILNFYIENFTTCFVLTQGEKAYRIYPSGKVVEDYFG